MVNTIISRQPNSIRERRTQQATGARITIFAIAKPFDGHAEIIQRNAISSWRNLGDDIEIILFGDDPGTAESAAELNVQHVPGIKVNQFGTPLVNDAFRQVRVQSDSELLVYCNCDIILLKSFVTAMDRLTLAPDTDSFVAIGRRTDLEVTRDWDFSAPGSFDAIEQTAMQSGVPGPVVCKEYFAFPRNQFREIPDFAVGRGNWDNWMVKEAKRRGIPVVDISPVAIAVHQNHDYSHGPGSRLDCYHAGTEARENQRLAAGKHVISGSSANFRLTSEGLRKCRLNRLNVPFWKDLPRFFRLLLDLMTNR